jgi:hypothetical protein
MKPVSATPRRYIAWSFALLGLALLAPKSGWAQGAPGDSNVVYAKVWTPRQETGRIHLHGGLFVPETDRNAVAATLGMRLGLNVGSHVLMGFAGDWIFKTKSLTQDSDSLPGIQPKIELARVDAQIFPAMVFMQVKLTDRFPIVPYFGVGAGYEWLILTAHDYRNQTSATHTFENPAWQAYSGVGLTLGRDVRLDGELFYNGATLKRQIVDSSGMTWNEIVDMNGVGARVGVSLLY